MATYNPGEGFSQGSGYGYRTNPFNHSQSEFHGGTDYKAAAGTNIPAAADGKVIYSGYNAGGNGNAVIIEHIGADGGKFYTTYSHMNGKEMPPVGKSVNAGDSIGQVGNTGRSTGAHLHFEVVEGTTPAHGNGGPVGYKNKDPKVHPDPRTFDNWPASGPYNGGTKDQPPASPTDPTTWYAPWDIIYDDGTQCTSLKNLILNKVNDLIRNASTYRIIYYYDPLVLDLNGNGIETVAANGLAGAMFDQNNDGIRTATGWISSSDGILVRDVNGNGSIDNGTEVFGDSTALVNGSTANNGFAALSDMDSNGDGVVDAQDANFAQLQVWRDLNQDGVSDAGELFTLQSLGIQSLNTAITSTPNAALAGGIQAQTGSFTRSDGTTSTMADINFTQDTFHSRYIDQIVVPAALQHLPNISDMGRLRDLQVVNNRVWEIAA